MHSGWHDPHTANKMKQGLHIIIAEQVSKPTVCYRISGIHLAHESSKWFDLDHTSRIYYLRHPVSICVNFGIKLH